MGHAIRGLLKVIRCFGPRPILHSSVINNRYTWVIDQLLTPSSRIRPCSRTITPVALPLLHGQTLGQSLQLDLGTLGVWLLGFGCRVFILSCWRARTSFVCLSVCPSVRLCALWFSSIDKRRRLLQWERPYRQGAQARLQGFSGLNRPVGPPVGVP